MLLEKDEEKVKIDVDSFPEMSKQSTFIKSPVSKVVDIASQIIVEIAEEDKNSGFGDYGDSSEEEDSDDDDDDDDDAPATDQGKPTPNLP